MIVPLVISAVLLVVVYVVFCYKKKMRYWKDKGVFTQPTDFLFGNAKRIAFRKESLGESIKDFYNVMKKHSISHGGFYFLTRPIFVPVNIDLIRRITNFDFDYFTDRIFHSHESDPLSIHLVALKGKQWKALRQKMSPAFTPAKVKMTFQVIKESVSDLIDVLNQQSNNKKHIDIHHIVTNFTVDAIVSTSIGIKANTLKNGHSDFKTFGDKFFSSSIMDTIIRTVAVTCPNLLTFFKIRSIHKDVTNFLIKVVTDVIHFREENNVVQQDLMHLLLQIRNNVEIDEDEVGFFKNRDVDKALGLTPTEIAAQCFAFLIAGYETGSLLVAFCLYELGLNQEIQVRAREEINSVLTHYNGELTYGALKKLDYLEKCINETLRKYPPFPVLLRECTADYKVPNTDLIIEKGTAVMISVSGIHHDGDYYKHPEVFDPERFEKNRIPQCTWIPFGDGPRFCIGSQVGTMMSKLTIASILMNFKFRVSPKMGCPIAFDKASLLLRANDGVWLSFEKI
ncbi:hypothetical protein FQA39_LY16867 [Lamprigera yunnana]|nr:hypothetical protein FQA39_LY16867 [Lamprigera yunnana]